MILILNSILVNPVVCVILCPQAASQITQYQARWEAHYLALQTFLRKSGGRYPSYTASKQSSEQTLCCWVKRQRHMHARQGNKYYVVSEARAARLQELPGWVWRVTGSATGGKWEAKFLALRSFLRDKGGRYPTLAASKPVVERALSSWVYQQRQAHTGKEKYIMSEARAARLQSLPGWDCRGRKLSGARRRSDTVPAATHAATVSAMRSTSPNTPAHAWVCKKKRAGPQ